MNQPVSNTTDVQQRIEGSMDKERMALTEVSSSVGGLAFKDMGQVMEFAKLMAVSKQAVPKHMRGQPGACMAVSLQALNWRMDPFAVANKSYMVNDRIAYEAQLIQAVIEQRAPIKGRIKGRYKGEGAERQVVLTVVSEEDGQEIEYTSPQIGQITTKNSPLWKADPDQQLWYYAARAMCRRHFPDVLLGVYEKEEIEHAPKIKDVTPAEGGFAAKAQQARQPNPEPEDVQDADVFDMPASDVNDDPEPEATTHWTDEIDTSGAFPGDDAFTEGAKAFKDGTARTDCPHSDHSVALHWLGGWDGAKQSADGDDG